VFSLSVYYYHIALRLIFKHKSYRRSSFYLPDTIINTSYDPITEELCGLENQVNHHGGLGGSPNYPILFFYQTTP